MSLKDRYIYFAGVTLVMGFAAITVAAFLIDLVPGLVVLSVICYLLATTAYSISKETKD